MDIKLKSDDTNCSSISTNYTIILKTCNLVLYKQGVVNAYLYLARCGG